MKFKVDIVQAVLESATIHVEAHSPEEAGLMAQYIAGDGRSPWERRFVDVSWRSSEAGDGEGS